MGKRQRRRRRLARLAEQATTTSTLCELRTTSRPVSERSLAGTAPVVLITPGWGTSGYYSPEVLQEAAARRVFPAGLHMFVDHPRLSDQVDRPERTVRDLAGALARDATYQDGPDGPGLYSEARIFGHFREMVGELADHVGLSIRAEGEVTNGEVDGRSGPIVDRIVNAHSVDLVVEAGRGGRFLELLEAAVSEARTVASWVEVEIPRAVIGLANRMWGEGGTLSRAEWEAINTATLAAMDAFRDALSTGAPELLTRDPQTPPEDEEVLVTEGAEPMPSDSHDDHDEHDEHDEQAAGRLAEALDQARSEAAQLREALTVRDATDHARQAVEELCELAQVELTGSSSARVVAEACRQIPSRDDGTVDREALTTRVAEECAQELAVLAEYGLDAGKPTSLGETSQTDTHDDLVDVFESLGLSPDAAKVAATGRR